jgi:hypothetical protein
MRTPEIPPGLVPVAQYVRMSTEHQQYSTENQSDVILRYAKAHGMDIIRTYCDAGKSGLSLSGKGGLRELKMSKADKPIIASSLFMTSATGGAFKMLTKAPITSMSAKGQMCAYIISGFEECA